MQIVTPLWQDIMPFPPRRSSPGSVLSCRTPGPSTKAFLSLQAAAPAGWRPVGLTERGRPASAGGQTQVFIIRPCMSSRASAKGTAPACRAGRGDAWMGSAEGHGPSSGSRPPQPLRLVPPRVPTDLRRCQAQPCATPRVRRAQPRPSQGSSGRTEPPRALSSQPPRPAGTVPPAGWQRQLPRAAAARPAEPWPAPGAAAQEALRETGTARGKGSPHGRRARAGRALLDWQPGKQIRDPAWGGAANGGGGRGSSLAGALGSVGAERRCRRLRLGRRQQRLLFVRAPRVGMKRLLAWGGVGLAVEGSLAWSPWGGGKPVELLRTGFTGLWEEKQAGWGRSVATA